MPLLQGRLDDCLSEASNRYRHGDPLVDTYAAEGQGVLSVTFQWLRENFDAHPDWATQQLGLRADVPDDADAGRLLEAAVRDLRAGGHLAGEAGQASPGEWRVATLRDFTNSWAHAAEHKSSRPGEPKHWIIKRVAAQGKWPAWCFYMDVSELVRALRELKATDGSICIPRIGDSGLT